jgi:hypothetical protein
MECTHFRTKRRNWRSLPAKGYKNVLAGFLFLPLLLNTTSHKKQNNNGSNGSRSGL